MCQMRDLGMAGSRGKGPGLEQGDHRGIRNQGTREGLDLPHQTVFLLVDLPTEVESGSNS